MTKPLTDVAIRKAAAGSTRRNIRDAGMRSLFLIVETSGSKTFQMRFRTPTGRIAKLTLGPYAIEGKQNERPALAIGQPLTLADARSLAADIHRQRAQGIDVIADRAATKLRQRVEIIQSTVTGFAANVESYIDHHARKNIREWREAARMLGLRYEKRFSQAEKTFSVIKGGLCDRWSDKPVTSIDQADIEAVIIEARRIAIPGMPARNKGRSEARARKLLIALSAFFTWLHSEGLVKSNPCRDVSRPKNGDNRDRVFDNNEIKWFWQAADRESGVYGPLLKLLLLTGARLDEVSGMLRSELSDDGATWNLPGSRTKNRRPHVVPLPPMARDLIMSQAETQFNSSQAGKNFVFTTTGTSPVSGWSRLKARLDRAMSEIARKENPEKKVQAAYPFIAPWRLHDLRRTAATGMAEIGVPPHIIEAVLNHISGAKAGVAGTYNRAAYATEKRAALERWAAHVSTITQPGKFSGEVIPMRKRK